MTVFADKMEFTVLKVWTKFPFQISNSKDFEFIYYILQVAVRPVSLGGTYAFRRGQKGFSGHPDPQRRNVGHPCPDHTAPGNILKFLNHYRCHLMLPSMPSSYNFNYNREWLTRTSSSTHVAPQL